MLRSKSATKTKATKPKDTETKILLMEGLDSQHKTQRLLHNMVIQDKLRKDEGPVQSAKRLKTKHLKQSNQTAEKGKVNSRPSSVEKKNQQIEKSAEKGRGSSKKRVPKAPKSTRADKPKNMSTKNTTFASSSSYLDAIKSSKQNTQAGEWDNPTGQEYGIQTNYLRLKQATNRLRSRRRGLTENTQDSSSEVSNSTNSKATVSSRLLRNVASIQEGGDQSKSTITRQSKNRDSSAKHPRHLEDHASNEKGSQYSPAGPVHQQQHIGTDQDITSDNLHELFTHAKKALKQKQERQLVTEKKSPFQKNTHGPQQQQQLNGQQQTVGQMVVQRNLNNLGSNVFAGGVAGGAELAGNTKVQPETGSFGSSKVARLVNNVQGGLHPIPAESREANQRKGSGDIDTSDTGVKMIHKFEKVPVRSDSPPDMGKRLHISKTKKKQKKLESCKDEKHKKEMFSSLAAAIPRKSALALSTASISKLLSNTMIRGSKESGFFNHKKTMPAPANPSKKQKAPKKKVPASTEKQGSAIQSLLRQSADNFKRTSEPKEYFSRTGFSVKQSKDIEDAQDANKSNGPNLVQASKLFSNLRTSLQNPVAQPASQPAVQFLDLKPASQPRSGPPQHLSPPPPPVKPDFSDSDSNTHSPPRVQLALRIANQFLPPTLPSRAPVSLPSAPSKLVETRFKEFVRHNEAQWREFLREVEGYALNKDPDASRASQATNSSLARRVDRVRRKAQKCLKIVHAAANNEESSLGVLSGEITAGMIQDSQNYGYTSSRRHLQTERNPADPYHFEEDLILEKSDTKQKDRSAAMKLLSFLPPVKENEHFSNPQSANHKTPRDQGEGGTSYLRFTKPVPYTPFEINTEGRISQKNKKSVSSTGKPDKGIKSFEHKGDGDTEHVPVEFGSNVQDKPVVPGQGSANSLKRAELGHQVHHVLPEGMKFCSSGRLQSLKDSDKPQSNYGEESASGSLLGLEQHAPTMHKPSEQNLSQAAVQEKSSTNQSGRSDIKIGIEMDDVNAAEGACQPTLVVSPLHQRGPVSTNKAMSRFHQHLLLEVWTNKNQDSEKLLRPRRSSGGASSSRASNRSLSEIQHNSLLHSKIDTIFGKSKTEQPILQQTSNGILTQSTPKQLTLRPAGDANMTQEQRSVLNDRNSIVSGKSPLSDSGSRTGQSFDPSLPFVHQMPAVESLHQQILGDGLGEVQPANDQPRNQLIEIHNWYEGSLVESPTANAGGRYSPGGLRSLFKQLNSPQHPLNDPEIFLSESSDQKPAPSMGSGVKPLFSSKLAGHFAINEVISSQQNDSQHSGRESIQPGQETPSLLHSPAAYPPEMPKKSLLLDSDEKTVHPNMTIDNETQNCAMVLELDQVLDPKEPFSGQNISGAEESIVFSSVGEKADIITSFILENLLVEAVAEDHCINKFIEVLGPFLLHLESSRLENYFSKLMEKVLGDGAETQAVLKKLNTPIGPSDLQRLMMSSPNLSETDQESLSSFLYEPVLDVKLYVNVEESLRESEYKLRELDQVQMERQHIVHKMIFDALNEVLDYKRLYGISGKPMPFESGFKVQNLYQVSDLRRIFSSAFDKLRGWEKIKAGRLLEKDPKTKHNEPEELEKIREKALEQIVSEYVRLEMTQTLNLDEKWSFTTEEYLESFLLVTECVLEQLVEDSVVEFDKIQASRSGLILSKGVPRSQTLGWNRGDIATRKLSKRGLGKQSVLFGSAVSSDFMSLAPEI